MLSPRLSECIQCSNILSLLSKIDCKLGELAKAEYNNIVFALNKCVQDEQIGDLLNYKRILTYKACNPDYACGFTVNMIASRIALYSLHDCPCNSYGSGTGGGTATTTPTTTAYTPPQPSTTSTSTTSSGLPVPICLSYSAVGGCAAACPRECMTYYTSIACANYIVTSATPAPIGCVIYTDPQGTILAPNGWYVYNNTVCYTIGAGGGQISAISLC